MINKIVFVLEILCLFAALTCLVSVYRLYTKLDGRIEEEAEKNAQQLSSLENQLFVLGNNLTERSVSLEQNLLSAQNSSAGSIRQNILKLDRSYRDFLEAQKRKTLESLYAEDVLTAERKTAADAFSAGRYQTASKLYREIAIAHPEDPEARFYQYYALFLSNKQNMDNYHSIIEAMNTLERQGYSRKELTATLKFITEETETGGVQP